MCGGAVYSAVASQKEGCEFNSGPGKFAAGSPASSCSPKTFLRGELTALNLFIRVYVSATGFVFDCQYGHVRKRRLVP